MIRLLGVLFCTVCGLMAVAYDWSAGVNVRDFGAKGDGVSDDTLAIQQALNYLRSQEELLLLARQPMVDDIPELAHLPILGSTTENTIQPELFFPAGRYRITNTLVAKSLFLRGEPGTVLVMEDPAKDLLYIDAGYRVRISDMEFEGGRRQVLLYTFNEDVTNFCVENCVFRNSAGYALWSHNYLRPGGYDYYTMTMGPYEVDYSTEIPRLTPNDESGGYYANSTLITVNNCRFENCQGMSDMGSDGMEFRDCVVRMPENFSGAAIKCHANSRFINLDAAAPKGGNSAWWIEAAGFNFVIENSSFRSNEESGMTLVRWNDLERYEVPSSLIIRDTVVDCGDAPLVVVDNRELENTPLLIEISGVTEVSGSGAELICWERPFEEERVRQSFYDFAPALAILNGSLSDEWPFFITVSNNTGFDVSGIPEILLRHPQSVIPADVLAAVSVNPIYFYWTAERDFPQELRAVDFGVDLQADTDDTEAMLRLFEAARACDSGVRVILPPALIRISESLELPKQVMLDAPGLATIRQSDRSKSIFSGTGIQRVWMRHLRLAAGASAMDVKADANAEFWVDKCFFYQQLHAALELRAPADNQAQLLLERSTFVSPMQGVVSNFAVNDLENFWVSSNGRQDRQAFLVNDGGAMRVYGMLGVPMPMKDHGHNHLPFVPDWPFANDLRWIDNYGKLDVVHSRFGGEYYGFVPVFQRGSGSIAIDGNYSCFGFPDCRNCIVYCEVTPEPVVFRNFGWEWRREIQRSVKYAEDNPVRCRIWCQNFLYERESFDENGVEK